MSAVWRPRKTGEPVARRIAVAALLGMATSGCAVLPGFGLDVSPDPRSVILAERDDAQGLARAHVITYLEAARRGVMLETG